MTPLQLLSEVWARTDHLTALHGYISSNVAPVVNADELLRAEWVARVSALDLYVHELVAQRMVAIFQRTLSAPPGYKEFRLPSDVLHRIQDAPSPIDASNAFDLELRKQLGYLSLQHPDNIAKAVRMCCAAKIWEEVAAELGEDAGQLKATLVAIVDRRNKIAHEGDMLPGSPRVPLPITAAEVATVKQKIRQIVDAMEIVVSRY